jgi:hypothetical protein
MNDGAKCVFGHVLGGKNGDDAIRVSRPFDIHRDKSAMSHRAADEINNEFAANGRQVIDVTRLAADVFAGGFVRQRLADGAHVVTSAGAFDSSK